MKIHCSVWRTSDSYWLNRTLCKPKMQSKFAISFVLIYAKGVQVAYEVLKGLRVVSEWTKQKFCFEVEHSSGRLVALRLALYVNTVLPRKGVTEDEGFYHRFSTINTFIEKYTKLVYSSIKARTGRQVF